MLGKNIFVRLGKKYFNSHCKTIDKNTNNKLLTVKKQIWKT